MILAACPYCKVGKVRAPADAIGASATCPRCYNSLTIVDSQSPTAFRPSPSKPAPQSSAVAVAPELAGPDSDTEAAAEPEERMPSIVAPLPPPRERGRDVESSFALAMVAFVLAGIVLPVTYLP